MAGNVVYEIMKYIKTNDLYSRVILFIHDSIEVDIHPAEFISIGSQIIPLMNDYPLREFGVPSAADLTVGVSLGQQLEVTELDASSDYRSASMVLDGVEDDFDEVINQFKDSELFKVIEWEDIEDPKESYTSFGDLFIPKLTIKSYMGTTRKMIKRRLYLELN